VDSELPATGGSVDQETADHPVGGLLLRRVLAPVWPSVAAGSSAFPTFRIRRRPTTAFVGRKGMPAPVRARAGYRQGLGT